MVSCTAVQRTSNGMHADADWWLACHRYNVWTWCLIASPGACSNYRAEFIVPLNKGKQGYGQDGVPFDGECGYLITQHLP